MFEKSEQISFLSKWNICNCIKNNGYRYEFVHNGAKTRKYFTSRKK